MKNESKLTEAGRQYAAAYAAHYAARDLPLALQLYQKLMASYPGAPEAEYSRMQIHNIVNAVIPKQELLDAEMKLALAHFEHDAEMKLGLAHFEHDERHDAGRSPVAPVASGLPA